MKKTSSAYVRGILGILAGTGIIIGASIIYPMTATNLAGHILVWVMSGLIGIKIALSAFEEDESWMDVSLETIGDGVQTVVDEARKEPVTATMLPVIDRMRQQVETEPILEFPANMERNLPAVMQSRFHQPDQEERKELIRFAAANPICSLATIDETEEEQPHVRTVFLWRADESGFYFVLFSSKHVSQQVKAHPDVEVCFQNHPTDISQAKQLRVHGHMDLVENRKLKKETENERSLLNTLAGQGRGADMEVFVVSTYEMKFWQMGNMVAQASKC